MPAVRANNNQKLVRGLGLMASASILSIMMAGEAQAACTPSTAQPLNNITTPLTTVHCTGVNTGQTITVNTDGVQVFVIASGATLDNSNVTLNGDSNLLGIDLGRSALNLVYSSSGNANNLEIQGNATNLVATLNGNQNNFGIYVGGTVTAAPGGIDLSAGVGQNQQFALQPGASLASTGNNAGNYLLTGGTGNQFFSLAGTLALQGNGLLINAGDGDDVVHVSATANFTSSNVHTINGGAGNDRLVLNGSGNTAFATTAVERLDVLAGVGGTRTMNENGSFTEVNVLSGTLSTSRVQALGQANSLVTLSNGTTLNLGFTTPTTVTNSFAGSGTILHNTIDPVTYGGSSSGFSGVFNILGGTATITSSDAFGSGSIVNGATLSFGGLNLTNNISGTGQVIVTGSGSSRLSGTNTFSGGLDIRGGILDVANVASLGSGAVTSSTGGGILAMGSTGNEVLSNNLTGNLALVMGGTGILDLTGTNSYTAGTLINNGAVRVDSFARLGTGQVIANAGGSLILNYNGAGQLLQTTPFMTGAGSFIKEGTGDVVMTQTSTYTGGTTIRAGRIGLNNGAALGTGNIQVDTGATLGIGNIVLLNDISGTGNIVKTASSTAELGGNNLGFTGTIDIQDGRIGVTDGRSLGSGTVLVGVGTVLRTDTSIVGDTTIVANLSGDGEFEKRGSNRVTLTGNNALTRNVFVGNGTLQIEGSQNIGSANIDLTLATSILDLSTSGSTTLSNNVGGLGAVVKTGTGTVFLTGSNSYSGGTDIQQGAIRVTDTSFLGTGAITVQAGAALDLSIAGSQTLNQSVTGAGILRKSDVGDLTLLSNGLIGGLDIVGGRVIVNTVTALGGGPVTTAADTQLVFDNGTTEVMSNPISGAGALTKDGTGALIIQNANSYTGGTIINAGRIGLNNGQGLGTGDVIVLQNAILNIGNVQLANNVSGAGQIVKTASSIGALTGINTHSGGTDIQGGTLVVNSPSALGTGAVIMGSGTNLIVDYSGSTNVALNNALTGSGTLVKDGSGTVVVNNSNSYSGGTQIIAGRLGLNFGNGLGTGGVVIGSGASLALGDVTYANATSGAGQIVKTSAGLTNVTGTNTHSGGIAIQAGTLAVSGNAALGSGTVAVSSGAVLEYTNANAATFSNSLSGAGSFNKLGSGQLTFANNFSIGTLGLTAGRTRINTIATANVNVGTNATLDGTGRIIGNLTNNGGTIAPGNSIGTLTVQGNYVHNANSVLEIEFDGAGNIDLLDVTGNATLNGGTLRFVSIGGAEGQGGTFLRTGGSLTGTFATVETVGAQLPLAVVYETNRAFMAPSVLTARPSTFNAQSLAAADTALGFIDSIGVGDVRHGEGNRIWLNGFGAWGKRSASGTTLAYDHDTRGMSGGVNFDAGGSITLGAALGWAKGDIKLGANGGGGDQSSVLGSLTARYSGTGVTLGGGVLYGKVDQDTLRNVSFNGFAGSVDGETDSKLFGAFAELGLPLGSTGGWTFSANARGSYVRQKQDGYTESGTSPLRLTLGDLKTSTMEGQAKLTAKTRLWDGGDHSDNGEGGLDLRVDLGTRYLGTLGDREIPVAFAVSGAGIVLQGDTRNTLQGLAGLALDYTTHGGATISLGYRGEIGKTDRHAVQAGVSFAF
ncbi:hypothetical protein DXH95_07860 [Sphingorhabdus pulchriflava]|uniref:Autotransporter domain-containing protein n=1 Tax=Sphingorhabdus pulchriflava TaxID=2292257 RepID=A0A371BI99_9SPHN|nr:autotransporter outer membrane beta-barrel domain-containing protein [Sphingorhabdus pulchriflava]RDV07268.1 hypothetical protein DXH95_07860 [Sphingorhabdus pulchriflava]